MRLPKFGKKVHLPFERELFLSLFIGLGSGVSTTTAILVGLILSEEPVNVIVVAGFVAIIVQAFNAATARYIGLRASEEIEDQTNTTQATPLVNAVVQFFTHILASIVPVLPIHLITGTYITAVSILLTGIAMLLLIGLAQGIFLKVQARQNMLEILSGGMLVMAVGILAGIGLSQV